MDNRSTRRHTQGMTKRPEIWQQAGHPAWLQLSAACARVARRAGARTDLVVRVHPGETMGLVGAPAAWYDSTTALLRVDARRVLAAERDDPRFIELATAAGRARHPVLVGVILQLAARAAHSAPAAERELGPWGAALEAARTQHLLVAQQPSARPHLRAAGRHQLSTTLRGNVTRGVPDGLVEAVLVLGLSAAGVLSSAETSAVRRDLIALLGSDALTTADEIIHRAVKLADPDRDQLTALADALAEVLGVAAGAGHDTGATAAAALDASASEARAMLQAAARGTAPVPKDDLSAARRHHARSAHRTTYRQGRREAQGTVHRNPSQELRREARSLARALRAALHPPGATELHGSRTPPGRLRLSEAMRADSQRSRGVVMTAQPWRQLRRIEPVDHSLRIGLSWDVSRSRSNAHERASEAAWALAWAARIVGAHFSAVSWNSAVRPVVWPDRVPATVAYPPCQGSSSGCVQSLRALDGALDLSSASGTRVVVVVSDGALPNRRHVADEVAELRRSGVRIVWLSDQAGAWNPPRARPLTVDPDASIVAGLTTLLTQALKLEDE